MLSHILGSNPSIVGHSELHRKYIGIKALYILRARVFLETNENIQNKYVLDKILHNPFSVSKTILKRNDAHFIFLLREPESTLKSIFKLGKQTKKVWQTDPDLVLKYYTKRLNLMGDYAKEIAEKYFYIESDDLIDKTNMVLNRLSNWLGLETELVEQYHIFNNTGKKGFGDPSDNIKSGEIITSKPLNTIEIPQNILPICLDTYQKCREVLKRHAGDFPQ